MFAGGATDLHLGQPPGPAGGAHAHHGYITDKDKYLNRMRRIEGQARGIHKMVEDGYLTVRTEREGRTIRKLYSATEKGRRGLAVARERMRIFTQEGTGR